MSSFSEICLSSPLEAALSYRRRGWAPIPLLPGTKKPAVQWSRYQNVPPSEHQIRKWWSKGPNLNVGVVLGKASNNLVAVDLDPRNNSRKSMRRRHLPPTFSTRTGGMGWHCLYQASITLPKRGSALPGVDLLGQGSYAVMPPSIHPSGRRYELVIDVIPEPPPRWVRATMRQKATLPVVRPATVKSGYLEAGTRNTGLFKAACGFMRGRCAWCRRGPCSVGSSEHLFRRVRAMNLKRCIPPLEIEEVRRIAENAWRRVKKVEPIPRQQATAYS